MKRTIAAVIVALTVFVASSAGALDTKEGRIKLELHENTGRFSLYYLKDVQKDEYVPLFFAQDPRTSVLTILQGNKTMRMGEAGGFQQSVENNDNTPTFVWTSPSLKITQAFTFIKSNGAAVVDGVKITLTLENLSNQPVSLGARYLIDTYLGEKGFSHFSTAKQSEITRETEVTAATGGEYFLSAASAGSDVGLYVSLSDPGVTEPSRVIFANWKRLDDSPWTYVTNPARNFNLLPYSINDSAAAVYYDPQSVDPGKSRTIVTVMGNTTSKGYSVAAQESSTAQNISQLYQNVVNSSPASGSSSTAEKLQSYYLTVNDVIQQINQLLASKDTVTDDQIQALREVIARLKAQSAAYINRE